MVSEKAMAELRADVEKNITSRIQEAVNNLAAPKLSPSKAEYWKAGARSAVMAVNEALDAALDKLSKENG